MKHSAANKSTQTLPPIAERSASTGVALAPPAYGMDIIDQQPAQAVSNHSQDDQPLESVAWSARAMAIQRQAQEPGAASRRTETSQKDSNSLPTKLKAGVEALSGFAMDDVNVHYNSAKPASVQALAYTQGVQIHLGPGQERHLPHEAWHVVQQKQGRAPATRQLRGLPFNDSQTLEQEAVTMGRRSARGGSAGLHASLTAKTIASPVVQGAFPFAQNAPIVIKQPGYATGDQFGIAATLIANPNAFVVITRGPVAGQPNHDPTDKAAAIQQFYMTSGVPARRAVLVPVPDVRAGANPLMQQAARQIVTNEPEFAGLGLISNQQRNARILSVTGGTEYVAKHWDRTKRTAVRHAWGVAHAGGRPNTAVDAQIQAWLLGKGVNTARMNRTSKVLVLWSRFSGKKGDIHLEHDTSYEGVRQIAWGATAQAAAGGGYSLVMIAGDKSPGNPAQRGKYSQIARSIGGGRVIDLTEFWSDNTAALQAWGGHTRLGQFKLYDFLERHFTVKHLGSRSGNLEAMAMLGYTVRYLEEPESEGGQRMEAWHDVGGRRTEEGGLATGYERLLVEQPTTRSGKYLMEQKRQTGAGVPGAVYDRRPAWAFGRLAVGGQPRSGGHKPFPIGTAAYQKGFTERDKRQIFTYLNLPQPMELARVNYRQQQRDLLGRLGHLGLEGAGPVRPNAETLERRRLLAQLL